MPEDTASLQQEVLKLKKKNIAKFIEAAELTDKFASLNYSKKRTNTSANLKNYLRQHKLYPRND